LHVQSFYALIIVVAIKASAAREIDALVADLTGPDTIAREAAIARLTVIGSRAVERLLGIIRTSEGSQTRISAFRALEGIRDPRSLEPALAVAASDKDAGVAAAAVGLARAFIQQEKGASIVERLTTLALDRVRPDAVRLAAMAALKDLPPSTVAPLLSALADDPSKAIRSEATRSPAATRPHGRGRLDVESVLARAADGSLPDSPDQLREALASAPRATTLAALLRIVERVRERESAESAKQRERWASARAAAHLALAKRRSRIGLYDLREWLESPRAALHLDALAALALIGDDSCLEPIATRYAAPQDEWSKTRLADLFRSIVTRDRVSRRRPVIKRIERKQKQALDELWPSPRTRQS
jgi:HEAT repeat protein